MSSVAVGVGGHLGLTKNSRGRNSEELGMPFGTSRVISIDVVFEHTTPVTVGEDQLEGLLVVLLHGLFVLVRLRVERRHFILKCPDL